MLNPLRGAHSGASPAPRAEHPAPHSADHPPDAAPPYPKPAEMYDTTLVALARVTGYRAGLGVEPGSVYDLALRNYGIDPERHSHIVSGAWKLQNPGKGLYLHRQVQHAVKSQSDTRYHICSSCGLRKIDPTRTTCPDPDCGSELPLRWTASRQYTTMIRVPNSEGTPGYRSNWALTPRGVAQALRLGCQIGRAHV